MTIRLFDKECKGVRIFDVSVFPDKNSFLAGASKFFRGAGYSTPDTKASVATNIDALVDYVQDWYSSCLGQRVNVKIEGMRVSEQSSRNFMILIAVINQAEISVIDQAIQSNDHDVLDKIGEISIMLSV